jgi:hypothetical protein
MIPLGISISSYLLGEPSAPYLVTAIVSEMIGALSLKYVLLKGALYSPLVPT